MFWVDLDRLAPNDIEGQGQFTHVNQIWWSLLKNIDNKSLQTDGQTDGRMDGRTDGQTDRRTDRQTDAGNNNTSSAEVAEG